MHLSVRYFEDMFSDPCNRDGFPRPFVVSKAQKLWHFIAPEYAIKLLSDMALYLSHFNEFDDKLEGALPVRTIEYWEEEARLNGWPASDAPRLLADLNERKTRSFASCWRADDCLWTEGFFRYARSPQEPKVCIQTEAGALGKLINEAIENTPDLDGSTFGLGHIWYVDHINGQTPTNNGLFHLMMKNSDGYGWEKEIRILAYLGELTGASLVKNSTGEIIGMTVNLSSLDWIRRVHVPESINSELKDQLLAVCNSCSIESAVLPEI